MKKFLKYLLFFIIPLVPAALLLDYFITEKLKNGFSSGGEFEVWNDIYNSEIDAEIAIYGSSRAWKHFDPSIFEGELKLSTYNLGVDGHNFEVQYLRHLEYFRKNPPPGIIILAVDEHSFGEGNAGYNKNQFLPYLFWEINPFNPPMSYEEFSFLEYSLPLLRYSGKREFINMSIVNSPEEAVRKKGYKGGKKKWTQAFSKAKEKYKTFRIEPNMELAHLLEDFIEEMKIKNIQLIMVNSPKYIEGQAFISNRAELLGTISEIADKHQIPYLDYSDDPICLDKKYFYNSMHLNKTGAELFTRKFIKEIKSRNLIDLE